MIDSLDKFRQKQEQLAEWLKEAASKLEDVQHAAAAAQLRQQANAAESFNFQVAVIGEFSAGKSTLLNALLGEALLPAKMPPCTAAPVMIRYGEKRRVFVKRKGEEKEHEEPFEKLHELIELRADAEEDIAREREASTIEQVIVEAPLALCRNRVTLLDTPGLNEAAARTQTTFDLLPRVDAAVVLLRATSLLAKSEQDFLTSEAAKPPASRRWMSNAFVAVNFADVALDEPDELRELKRRLDSFCDGLLKPRGLSQGRRYFIDSRSALQQRAGKSPRTDGVEFAKLHSDLEEFVLKERGAAGWQSQVLMATRSVVEATQVLKADVEGYKRQAEQARGDAERARSRLEAERKRVERMADSMRKMGRRFAKELGNEFTVESHRWIDELPAWLDTVKYPDTILARVKKPTEWFTNQAIEWIFAKVQEWCNATAPARFQAFVTEFEETHADDLCELKKNLSQAALDLGLPDVTAGGAEEEGVMGWLFRSAAGYLAGGPLGTLVGSTMGWSGVLTNAGINLGLGILAAVVDVIIPVVGLVIVAAVVASIQIFVGQEVIQKNIRGKVVDGLKKALPGKMVEAGQTMTEHAEKQIDQLAEQLQAGASSIIEQLADGVSALEHAARSTEAERDARIGEIKGALGALEKLGQRIQEDS